MASQLVRVGLTRSVYVSRRHFATSSVRSVNPDSTQMSEEYKNAAYPRIGNRDIVGRGMNGEAQYADQWDVPMPSIRFKANSPEILALREKEKGDWKSLTMDEKKELYRASFRQTFSEMKAPSGEWKLIVAGVLFGLSATCWISLALKTYVFSPLPHTITDEWRDASLKKMVDMGVNNVTGITSDYDYEKNEWKK